MDAGIKLVKMRKFKSLSFKLTIWYILLLGIVVGLAGLFLYEGFKKSLMEDLDKTLDEIAVDVNNIYRRARGITWYDAIREAEEKYRNHRPLIQVVEFPRRERNFPERIFRSNKINSDVFLLRKEVYYKADKSGTNDLTYINLNEEKLAPHLLRVIMFPVRGPYIIQVGISLEGTAGALGRLLVIMMLAGLLLLFFASLGGSFIIRKALVPVKSVVRAANEITADDLSLRIDSGNRQDEIGALVNTFNNMIARLEKSVKKIKQFSGDVSHELRTPLTIIRGEIEILLRKDRESEEYQRTLKSVLEEANHMEKIIDDLLFLSRIEASNKIKFTEKILLDEIILEVFKSREQSAKSKGINFEIKKIIPVEVKGEKTLLERLISNIIDNAIRYTPSEGRIEINLERNDRFAVLSIRDTGIGLPEEELPFIFDRFYVVDKSRCKESGGAGLGLSIVKSVADSHGALIGVQSKINQGTTFRVKFPLF